MAVHIDLITCCHFPDDYGRNVELFTLPKTIFVKELYHLKVKSFDFPFLATFL